jgi:hypothetical protein
MIGSDDRRYQVFVSSTFDDLQEERQKVLQAVLEMKAFPAGMELFPSANDEQWAFIQREIESSDYYIVITAGKYGSLAEDGRSFTEKEYDYALDLKKYVISFLRHDLLGLEGRQLEQEPDRRQKLEAFHEKVKRSKLVKFYNSPEELKSLVMQALVHAFRFQPQEGWVRAKNARRLEDLEDVARLQKRVMELEAENAKLSADPTAPFAQGDDTATWTLGLVAVSPSPGSAKRDPNAVPEDPPAEDFAFRTTWNDLLAAIFINAEPRVYSTTVRQRVARLIISQIAGRFPEAKGWLAIATRHEEAVIASKDFSRLIVAIQRQFLGLGLVDVITTEKVTPPFAGLWPAWQLTQGGRLQLLAVSGLRRNQT